MNRRTILASAVFASLTVCLICRFCKSDRVAFLDSDAPCQNNVGVPVQTDERLLNPGSVLSDESQDVPQTEDATILTTYPDSIWGLFRAENNDRFHEILHGFETKGALAPIDLFVCDENGDPIPGASVRFSWSTTAGIDHDKKIFGVTDESGHFSAEEQSIWMVGWRVEKEGYYAAYSNLELQAYATVQGWKERRWFRAPFPVTAVLHKKTHHRMTFREIKIHLPPVGVKFGFDLVEGLPTPPHGDGHASDIVFYEERSGNFDPRSTDDWFTSLHMEFPGDGNGVARFKMDDCSDLKSPRFAPDAGYDPAIESKGQALNGCYTDKDRIPPEDYLVVRIRSSIMKDGIVTNAIYGKMRGYWYVNGRKRLLTFWTWMNEKPNDLNLEDNSGRW
ncbi:MAG: Ig-like domain-containing protein [Kiritimatiellae bacterium]|nr:Ig-like domain-containing protein [Kiritimatiellia bacterium]